MSDAQEHQGVNPAPTAEELKQEDEALQDAKQEEVRASIIEKYGLDEDSQADLIDKLVGDTLEQRKAMGKAIRQKRDWRNKATNNQPPKPEDKPQPPQQQKSVDVDALVNERFEQRDLESLDFPDELKADVQKLAKLNGISVRKAAQDPYIVHRKQEIERQAKADDAAITRKGKGTTVKFDPDKPPQVDMSTEEGRKTWDDWKKFSESKKTT